jgi:hypothetical protein
MHWGAPIPAAAAAVAEFHCCVQYCQVEVHVLLLLLLLLLLPCLSLLLPQASVP